MLGFQNQGVMKQLIFQYLIIYAIRQASRATETVTFC